MKLLNRLKRATELLNSGNLVEAEKQFKDILRSHPTNLAALYSLALVYRRLDNSLLTLHYCDRTVKVDPKFMNGWFGRGVALHSLNRHDEAIESYKRVLHLNPGFVDALNNLGVVQKEAGRYQEAVETYDRLLAVNPADERGLAHKGYILSLLQRYDEAIECLGKLLDLNMEYPFALGLMSSAMQYGCIWHDFDRISTLIGRGVRENKPACKSLVLMSVSDSAAEYLHSAQAYAELMCPPAPLKLWQGEIYHHPKIRIAYVSPDFGEHPVAHLLAGVLEHHDKSRFEIFGFSLVADQGRMRQRLTAAVDRFFDVQNSSSREIAEMIRAMEIDILVDLSGYTQDSRTDMFAYRPAPLQVNYLGYPGTLGVEYMDYILADRVVIPDADHCYYREKVVCLPGSYLPADATLTVADRTPAREEFGLPESGVVFCSFNHAYKINPTMFAAWMRILKGCPGSVLWLMSLNSTAEPNLRKEAAARGIDPSRLVFAIRVPKVEDHLARYRLADLFLDTIPYNAHTTACDALFVGLPVLTCLGSAFPGRVAASLLNAVGMPELITQTMEEYEKLALHLAHNPDKLANIRKKLQVNLAASQLYDTGGYCRNLEAAYTVMWERYQHGQEPAAIEIASSDLSVVATGNEQRAENMQSEEPGGDDSLALAQELFCQGNLPQAEIYARRSLVQGNNAGATGLLEDLRRGYGISEFFELSERALMGGGSNDRFLLIKAWGYGFWSELHHLATQLLLAELTRRRPIILWGKNCLFRNETDTNAFGHFFQEIFGTRLEDVPRSASIYPQKWSWGNICEENVNKWGGDGSRLAAQYLFDRPETLVVSDFFSTINSIIPWISPSSRYYGLSDDALYFEMFRRYLKPVASITARVNSFFEQRMQGRHWAAVHVRGADKVNESPHIAQTNVNYFGFVDRIIELNPEIGIFLLTDSLPVMEEFTARYGERVLCTEATRSNSTVGVHYMNDKDGIAVGEEVLLDVLLACKCDYFVGNKESNVSMAIVGMRHWPEGFGVLLGEQNIRGENLFLHQCRQESKQNCRLCGSPAESQFSCQVMFRYPVTYYKCSGCGSLQTEFPYWLDDAYAHKPERFDTGKASRTLANFFILRRMFEILGIRPHDRCADFGGGTGLFARLMRDTGYNFYSYDKYGSSEFCDGFSWERFDRPVRLVTIFECAEHFVNPVEDWEAILATGADYIIGTTGIYNGQGGDWAYLSPESGQHLFFYSPAAFAHIAGKHGWFAYILGGYFLLSKIPLSEQAGAELVKWGGDLGNVCNESFHSWLGNPYDCASRDNRRVAALARLRSAGTRIALDGTFFRFATGISRLWKSLLAEWSANGFGEFIVVIDRARTAPRFAGITYLDAPLHDYAHRQTDRRLLQDICDRERITLFTSTYYTTPLTTRGVLMVPDMIPEVMEFDLSSEQWQEKHDAIRYCRNYIAISSSTANDLRRFFPEITSEQVVTAYCGTDFRTPATEQVRNFKERYGIDRPYFLISGVKSGYKNAMLFFQAFKLLGDRRREYAIVCTNSLPTLEPELQECVADAKVHLLVLSDDDLQCAYAGAVALVYPSRYEGFGLPVLEAMACSCPVITCNNSSIGEVAGDAAVFVDPDDPEALRAALLAVQNADRRCELIDKGLQRAGGFTWRKMADQVESTMIRWSFNKETATITTL